MTDRLLTAINAERDAHKAQIKALTRDVVDATPEARETYLETVRASEWARIETEDAYKEAHIREWVCDSCLTFVRYGRVAIWADGEHVICQTCAAGVS